MGVRTAVFANPYLIALWKTLWMLANYSNPTAEITEEECIRISAETGLGAEYLRKKVMAANTNLSRFKKSTLNSLCAALHKRSTTFPLTWEEFQRKQERKRIYIRCQALENKLVIHETSGDPFDKAPLTIDKSLRPIIIKQARSHAKAMYDKSEDDIESNLPPMSWEELSLGIDVASEEDVTKIYEFAIGRYGDCSINGPDIKLPWWRQNSNIFFIIHDRDGKVCANINLLPLKPDCYARIRSGIINERGILAEDLYRPEEKSLVKHIYVEGFNAPKRSHIGALLALFPVMINTLANPKDPELVIGAIGGTDEGESIMDTLGFEIVTPKSERSDECDFFEVNYHEAVRERQRQGVNITQKK